MLANPKCNLVFRTRFVCLAIRLAKFAGGFSAMCLLFFVASSCMCAYDLTPAVAIVFIEVGTRIQAEGRVSVDTDTHSSRS